MSFEVFAQASQPSTLMSLLPFILIMVIIWFFMIRPQAKKQKDTQKMLSELKRGDKVLTMGGIIGEIDSLKDEATVILKIGKDMKVEFRKSAVSGLVGGPVKK